MPFEEKIESANKSRTDAPSWLDNFSQAYQQATDNFVAFQRVWMPWNPFLAFHQTSAYKQIESPWAHATTLQIAHVVGMRHFVVAHKRRLEKTAHRTLDLTALYARYHVGKDTLPGPRELIEGCLETFKPYGIIGRGTPHQGQIAYPFGDAINLEDLTWQGAFQGSPDVRRDCGFINFEHCVFNTHKGTYAPMQRADLRDTNLRRANLQWCDLSGSDFCGADLRGANLENAKLDDVLYDSGTMIDQSTKLPYSFRAHLVTRVDKGKGDVFGYKNQRGFQTDTINPLYPTMRAVEKSAAPAKVIPGGSSDVDAHQILRVDFKRRAKA